MNHMNEVAKMLGVEMGEEFSLNLFKREKVSGYYFDRFGLQRKNTCSTYPETLGELIQGTHEIVKLPFKPKENEPYWFWCNPIGGGGEVAKVYCRFGGDSLMCRECYMLGNCYRTEAECEADTAMKERIEKMERCKMVKERIYIAKPIVENPLLERLDSAAIIAWFRCNSCLTCRFREKVIDVDKKKDIHWCSRTHQSANFIDMVEFLGYSKE